MTASGLDPVGDANRERAANAPVGATVATAAGRVPGPRTPTDGMRVPADGAGHRAPGPPGGLLRRLLPATVTVALGVFLSVLDSAIVGIAYPAIEKDLGATSENVQWITTAYKLTQGVTIPAAIWLCRRYGLRRMYVASLLAYAVASGLCAVAANLSELVAFRILQAVPGALTPIVCVGIIYKLVPKAAESIAFGLYAMIAISAPGFAPFIGGLFVQYLDWRAIFLVVVPVAVVGIAAAALLLPPMAPAEPPPRFDLAGFASASLGSFCLLLALSKGSDWGWTSYLVLILVAIGVNALVVFVAVELRTSAPLLNLRIFASRPFVAAVLVLEVMFVGINAVISYLPVFLLQAQSMTPTQAGLVLVPQAVCWLVAIPLAGLLWQAMGAKRVTIVGLALMGGATLMLGRLNVDMPRDQLVTMLSVRAFGLGLVMIPMLGGAVAALPEHLLPDGIAFRTIVQRTGAALGLAAVSILITARRAQQLADQSGLVDIRAPYRNPAISQMQHGPGGLVPMWEGLQARSLTLAYSDAYVVLGVLTLAAIAITLFADWPTPPRLSKQQLVEAGL